MLTIRSKHSAFSPVASQEILELDFRVFAIIRKNEDTGEVIYVLINVSNEDITLELSNLRGRDLLSGITIQSKVTLKGLQPMWIHLEHEI